MTDRQVIEQAKILLRTGGVTNENPAIKRLIEIAEARQPVEGSVEVRIAVSGYKSEGGIIFEATAISPAISEDAAKRHVSWDANSTDWRAIVTAHIPPVKVQEVEGTVEGESR